MSKTIPTTKIRYCKIDPNSNVCFENQGYSLVIVQVDNPEEDITPTKNLLLPNEDE